LFGSASSILELKMILNLTFVISYKETFKWNLKSDFRMEFTERAWTS